jgi:hypothetical protein
MQKIRKQEDGLRLVLETWFQLAGAMIEPELSFLKVGEKAATLLELERKRSVVFVSHLPDHLKLVLPQTVALGVFFLLFKAMEAGIRSEGALTFQLHKRECHGQFLAFGY